MIVWWGCWAFISESRERKLRDERSESPSRDGSRALLRSSVARGARSLWCLLRRASPSRLPLSIPPDRSRTAPHASPTSSSPEATTPSHALLAPSKGARRRAPTARSHLINKSCSAVWLRWRAPRAGRRPVSERARETGGAAERFRRLPPVEAGAVRGCGAGRDWKGQPRGRRTAKQALQGASEVSD